jgi:hypothetical protein
MGVMSVVHTLRLPRPSGQSVRLARRSAERRPAVAWSLRRRELVGRCVLGAVMLAARAATRVDEALGARR